VPYLQPAPADIARARRKISVHRGGCGCAYTRMDTARALTICPGDFAPLFGGDLGDAFILVTTPATRELLVLEPDAAVATEELVWTEARGVDDLRDRLREHRRAGHRSSVLWIVEDEFIHLGPHELRSARLGAISFFSGSLSSENLASCLDVVRRTDYQRDLRIESALLAALDSADDVRFRSDDGHAEAIFRHVDCEHWFSSKALSQTASRPSSPPANSAPLLIHQGGTRSTTGSISTAPCSFGARRSFIGAPEPSPSTTPSVSLPS